VTIQQSNTAYLFQCPSKDLAAVSHDITGANIPRTSCAEGWLLRRKFQLGVREDVPAPIMPEPIIRGIRELGFYIWRGWSPLRAGT
jgi:hypothetical protein